MSKPYSVNLWGSDPSLDNDDCWTGEDFATLEEAEAFFNNPFTDAKYAQYYERCTAVIELDGPDVHRERNNPAFKPSKADDSDWQREHAMQAGMMGGCDAYNDAMGY